MRDMKALVFTPTALFSLSQCEINEAWFGQYALPKAVQGIKRVQYGEYVYFLEDALDRDDGPIIVINLSGDNPVFLPQHKQPNNCCKGMYFA